MSELSRTPRVRDADAPVRTAGDRALLLVPRPDRVTALAHALAHYPIPGMIDVLPAAETVLVTLGSAESAAHARPALAALVASVNERDAGNVSRGTLPEPTEPVRIPVHYDGPDLEEVARLSGMRPEDIVAAHTGTIWHCVFVGFAPGFGYLESPDLRLHIPRRPAARTRIPAGAVGLAGGYSAVYPRQTPGGWQLIGHTELAVWDVEREPPALIRAGARIRFYEAGTGA